MREMQKSQIDISPFNSFYFKDCIYNSLFSVLSYYDKPIWPVLANTSITYKAAALPHTPITKHTDALLHAPIVEYTDAMPLEMLLERMGAPIRYYDNHGKQMLNDIRKGIEEGIPTGVFVDCYSEKTRKDTFGIQHNDHCILVCGYDSDGFTVLEQSSMNALNYRPVCMSKEELLCASNGYYTYYVVPGKVPAYMYYQLQKSDHDDVLCEEIVQAHAAGILTQDDRGYICEETIGGCMCRVLNVLLGKEECKDWNDILIMLNDIVNIRKMQQALYGFFWSEVGVWLKEAITEWSFFRMSLFRLLEGVYDDENRLTDRFMKLTEIERKILHAVLAGCNKILE